MRYIWLSTLIIFVALALSLAPFPVLAQGTETPTLTSTPTATRTPMPTPIPYPTATSQAISQFASSSSNSQGDEFVLFVATAVSGVQTMQAPIVGVQNAIATINPMLTVTGTAMPNTFTVSGSDPALLARGVVMIMRDITWFAALTAWFVAALLIIIFLMAARFFVSLWGIVSRIITIVNTIINAIKLIPFL